MAEPTSLVRSDIDLVLEVVRATMRNQRVFARELLANKDMRSYDDAMTRVREIRGAHDRLEMAIEYFDAMFVDTKPSTYLEFDWRFTPIPRADEERDE